MLRARAILFLFLLLLIGLPEQHTGAQGSGDPSLAFPHRATLGQTGLPWLRSNALLNQPWGLAGDREGVWIANAAGRNLLRFGAGMVEELGRAGSIDGLPGHRLRFPADLAVVQHETLPQGATGFPLRTVWIVDRDAHAVIGVPLDHEGLAGQPRILGRPDQPGDDDAHLRRPVGVAADDEGRVYVSDGGNHRVQIFAPDGRVIATIGRSGQPGGAAGQLDRPARLALAENDRLYIADSGNHRVVAYDVRDPSAPVEVQVYGQTGQAGSGDDRFREPSGVAIDATFLYVADTGNRRVQVLEWRDGDPFASLDGTSRAGCGGSGSSAWGEVSDVALDVSSNLYIALPTQMRVKGCDAQRGPRPDLSFGALDQPYRPEDDLHNAPRGVAVAADGSVAVVESEGHRVVRYGPDGSVAWVAGSAGLPGQEPAGASAIRLKAPTDAAFLPDGRLLVSDTGNGRLLLLDGAGARSAVWGEGQLDTPAGLTVLADGSLAVADAAAGRLRRFDAGGAYLGDLRDASGPIDLDAPADVVADSGGGWIVSEPERHRLLVLDATGTVTGQIGRVDQPGDAFDRLDRPTGLALDAQGRLLVVDSGNHRLQVLERDGLHRSTIGGRQGEGSGGFSEPAGVAVGPDGRIFVADTYNHRVQVFSAADGTWLPAADSGLGDRSALAIGALAEKDGWLYAGTGAGDQLPGGSSTSTGAEIWRREGSEPWQRVLAGGLGDPDNRDVIAMQVFDGQLYAGVENRARRSNADGQLIETSAGGELWRSADGRSWQRIVQGGFGDSDQSGIGPLTAFDGRLYAGTSGIDGSTSPQLWRSASGDPGSWERIRIELFSRDAWPHNGAVSAMAVYSNALYLGTCSAGGGQIWRSQDGEVWRAAAQLAAGGDPRDALPELGEGAACVGSLVVHEGRLYAGMGSDALPAARLGFLSGAALPRQGAAGRPSSPVELWSCLDCDGTDWELAAAPGFGDGQNRGALRLAGFDEPPFRFLYAFAGNADRGLQVWRAGDGRDWEPVSAGGFGDDNNIDPGGGDALRVYRNRLHLGSVNRAHGGELWSTAGTRPDLLPTSVAPQPSPTPRPRPQPSTGRARYRQVDAWPLSSASPRDQLSAPVDMALASDGAVYLLDSAPSRVLHLGSEGRWRPAFGELGGGPDRITRAGALALDEAAGRLYVSDRGTRRLVVFDRTGRYQQTLLFEVQIAAIFVRPDGSLWLADDQSGSLRRVAADGSELERFGRYASDGDDGFDGFAGVMEDARGDLWVSDVAGDRIRRYRRDPTGAWQMVQDLDLVDGPLQGCSGQRLQPLPGDAVLAGACVLDASGRLIDQLPAQHRGSDLYGVGLRSASATLDRFAALATYDLDRNDPDNATRPAIVRYHDEGFDIVTGYDLGGAPGAAEIGDRRLDDPFRIDALPDGDVVVMDANARVTGLAPTGFFRRFTPDGRVRDTLAVRSYPSQSYRLMQDADLSLATGNPGELIGIAGLHYGSPRQPSSLEVATRQRSVKRRYCSGGSCWWGHFAEPIWQTTLINLNLSRGAADYNYAATFEHGLDNYVLLQLWADNPSGIANPARLFFFDIDGWGRKTAVALEGTERETLWTDVDAGPDGSIHALDALADRVWTFDATGQLLRSLDTPKDAWKVAGGPNGEVYLLTTYGFVVRLAPDGSTLSRWSALPNELVSPTALMDLAVDAWGRVYTVDTVYDQVTVFEPEGTEADVLEGDRCHMDGDKWVDPKEILLGDSADLQLSLFGSCGFVEDPSDIVLMVNARFRISDDYPYLYQEAYNLRVARQILSVVDLDRHRVGIGSFVMSGRVEEPLTQDRDRLIRSLFDVAGGRTPTQCPHSNTEVALRIARDMFEDSPPDRRKVLVLVQPDADPGEAQKCPHSARTIDREARELHALGITILAVNGSTTACSSYTTCGIPVADRGQGTGRPAVYHGLSRRWPAHLFQGGQLVDRLPDNIDYVAGSARPPATWDPVERSLTWDLDPLALGSEARFELEIRPREVGLWPTNVEAFAETTDGWGHAQRVDLPVPRIRVYDELPPTATFTPSTTPTPSMTPTPSATLSPEPTPTSEPGTIYLPILLHTQACRPETRSADVALVIDSSGSMAQTTSPGGPTKLDAAREAARSFLGQMQAGRDQASLIQFNQSARVLAPLGGDIDAVSAALDQITQDTGTRIDLALALAGQQLQSPARKAENNAVLILLTDGEPSGTTPAEVRAEADAVKAAGILIFTIGLGRELDVDLLQSMASRPDWYYAAPDTSDLAAIYERIAYEIPCRPDWP